MKKILSFPFIAAVILGISSCDKNFEQINTNPTAATSLDPVYQFSSAQVNSAVSTYHYQGEIVQQVITPYGGVLEGGNRNTNIDQNANALYNTMFTGPIRNLIDVTNQLKDNPARSNLYNMARIWKAYCFQMLVDTYGDVPYSEAGKGFLESTFLPKYDDQKLIYEDLLKEYQEATDGLDPAKDKVGGGDLFYNGDIARWKKLGNSLLLRAGMRYTKIDAAKAKAIVTIAVNPSRGGVMASNNDNAYIQFNAVYTNGTSSALLGGERHNYYIGKPFVDYLKATNDPRLPYIAVKYEKPTEPLATVGAANTNPADQEGMPYGYDENSVANAPGFPGKTGSAFKYSQFNRSTVFRIDAPEFMVTYAQTLLLLAEARVSDFITTGDAKEYYEAGIRAHMTQTPLYGTVNITSDQQNAFLLEPEVAFTPARALEQINEQYWVASFRNWAEAWANFRRSGYPQLTPINFPGEDPSVDANNAGGFIHRLPYPVREKSVNTNNVNEAISRMGADNLGTRIFWDKP